MRIGVLTGGGDCPGLNAVIRAVVKSALNHGWEVWGFREGFVGVVEERLEPRRLDLNAVSGIVNRGGTILGTSNKGNPFQYAVKEGDRVVERDLSEQAISRLKRLGIDALVAIGGDGTLKISHQLAQRGLKVVGCPKTIDNDLSQTDQTFGFDTAHYIATEAVDRLHSTAEAHDRVMVLELMGRDTGHLTLHSAIAGGADVALLPEIPYSIEPVVQSIRERAARGKTFSIIVVAEGARPRGGTQSVAETADKIPGRGVVRLGGAGKAVADAIAERVKEHEVRVTVLGHLQRGGQPTATDRILGTRFGCKAVEMIAAGQFDHMAALQGSEVVAVPLGLASKTRFVDPTGELVRHARSLGIVFGDEGV